VPSNSHRFLWIAAAAVVLAACGKKEPPPPPPPPPPAPVVQAPPPPPAGVTLAAVTLGKAVGADKKVSAATETFAKGDTIHASVDTTGAGKATLAAKWTFHKDGKSAPVKEDSATVDATGPATTEFHISKPDGWPAGEYQVEISVDGKPVATKTFKVQ
jgi:multidrug efflux pump subunit AcrA (membrane-fusion protein)